MNWNDVVNDLLLVMWPALLIVVGRYLLPKVKEWLDVKIDGEKHGYAEKVAIRATDAIYTVVTEIGQTYVDAIKEGKSDGKLDDAEKAEAKKRATSRAKQLIGPEGIKVLAEVLGAGGVESFISSKIEAAVKDSKPRP